MNFEKLREIMLNVLQSEGLLNESLKTFLRLSALRWKRATNDDVRRMLRSSA